MKTAREHLCDALGVDDRRLGELLRDEYCPPRPYLPDILKAIAQAMSDARLSDKWNEYPATKPDKDGVYAITYEGQVYWGTWEDGSWSVDWDDQKVTAWMLIEPFSKERT